MPARRVASDAVTAADPLPGRPRRRRHRQRPRRRAQPRGRRLPRGQRAGEGVDDAHRHRPGRGALRGHGPRHRGVGRIGRQHHRRRRLLRRARPPTSAGCSTTSSARCSPTTCGPAASCSASAPATDGPPTGRCLIVVTPDAQRTMNTYLGSSEFFGPEHVDVELIAAAQVTYLEGYLFDRPPAQEAYWKASQAAHDAGRRVASPCPTRSASSATATRGATSSPTRSTSSSPTRTRPWRSTRSTRSTTALAAARADVRGRRPHPRRAGLGRGPRRRGGRRSPPTRSSRWSTPPAPATSTPPGSCSASRSDRSMADCGRLGSVAASAVIGHTGPAARASRSPSWPTRCDL